MVRLVRGLTRLVNGGYVAKVVPDEPPPLGSSGDTTLWSCCVCRVGYARWGGGGAEKEVSVSVSGVVAVVVVGEGYGRGRGVRACPSGCRQGRHIQGTSISCQTRVAQRGERDGKREGER